MIADDIRKLANHEDYRSVISIKISRFYLKLSFTLKLV